MLGRLDYRNLRWEGALREGVPDGVGLLIDHHRLFCIGEWRQGRTDGPLCVIYPDRHVFCGVVRQDKVEVGCFYLREGARVYVGGGSQKTAAVLPFCSLVLELGGQGGEGGMVAQRHLKYSSSDQLHQVVGNLLGVGDERVTAFDDWRLYLKEQICQKHTKSIEYSQRDRPLCMEVFVGVRHQGIGAKLLQFRKDNWSRVEGVAAVVEEMGVYSSHHRLTSLAMRALPNSNYEQYQQGELSGEGYQSIEYRVGQRPTACNGQMIKWLKISSEFVNKFMQIAWVYALEQQYCNIDVKNVEETQKVTQVLLKSRGAQGQEVLVAEIADDRHRKISPLSSGIQLGSASEEHQIVEEPRMSKEAFVSRSGGKALGRQEYNAQAMRQLLNRLESQASRRRLDSNKEEDSSQNRRKNSNIYGHVNDTLKKKLQEKSQGGKRIQNMGLRRGGTNPPKVTGVITSYRPRQQPQPPTITRPSELNWSTPEQQYQLVGYQSRHTKQQEQDEQVVAFFNAKIQESLGASWEETEEDNVHGLTQIGRQSSTEHNTLHRRSGGGSKKPGRIRVYKMP